MNITSKSRYALKIMMDMAHFYHEPLIRRSEIVQRQGIPSDYLDQIMMRLRSKNIVESIRGRAGGYKLARNPDDISLWEVFEAVEDSFYPTECLSTGHICDFEVSCVSKDAWTEIFDAVRQPLQNMKVGALAKKWAKEHQMCPLGGVRECRHG